MPASDGLQPPLSPAERDVVKSYGGWTRFCASFGLKPWNDEDAEEAMQILRSFTTQEEK
uniref:Uncharacterized protein n=1 Tax=Talaromyces marneffei PM1 TaxID=1077442 RepID=A0A093V2F4_TALMA